MQGTCKDDPRSGILPVYVSLDTTMAGIKIFNWSGLPPGAQLRPLIRLHFLDYNIPNLWDFKCTIFQLRADRVLI